MSHWSAPLAEKGGRVAWRRVALYYGIAFGLVSLLALGLWAAGASLFLGNAKLVFQLTIAFLYMPAPLIAALVVERVARRGYLIARTFTDFGRTWWRILVYSAAAAIGVYVVDLALVYLLGNVAHVSLFGSLAMTQRQLFENLSAAVGAGRLKPSALETMPPAWVLYLLGALVAMPVGLTVNGLFAFGEEYGWRGVLMDELRPLGPGRANLLTGVLWAFWHFPIILLGFDYASRPVLGVLVMAVCLVPFSFLLWRSREFSGTVVTAAVVHGAFNGSAGFFYFFVTNRDPLLSAPLGLIGAAGMAIVAGVLWAVTRRHLYHGPADPLPGAEPPVRDTPAVVPGATPQELLAETRPDDPDVGADGTGLGELP